jgi:hypothetical protein
VLLFVVVVFVVVVVVVIVVDFEMWLCYILNYNSIYRFHEQKVKVNRY